MGLGPAGGCICAGIEAHWENVEERTQRGMWGLVSSPEQRQQSLLLYIGILSPPFSLFPSLLFSFLLFSPFP